MSGQSTLFDAPPEPLTLAERFEAFDEANPHVYEEIVSIALELIERGVKRWSIAGIYEIIRYRVATNRLSEKYACNNSFRAHFARKFQADYPEHAGFFSIRKRQGEE